MRVDCACLGCVAVRHPLQALAAILESVLTTPAVGIGQRLDHKEPYQDLYLLVQEALNPPEPPTHGEILDAHDWRPWTAVMGGSEHNLGWACHRCGAWMHEPPYVELLNAEGTAFRRARGREALRCETRVYMPTPTPTMIEAVQARCKERRRLP